MIVGGGAAGEAKLVAMRRATPRPPLPPGPYLVVGLARSGQAAARALAQRGERVIGADSGAPEGAAGLRGYGVEVILDVDGVEALESARCVVKSPGVPATAPVITGARERSSTALKTANRATETPIRPSVCADGRHGEAGAVAPSWA